MAQRRAVGMSDVAWAATGMNALVEADDRRGGHVKWEKAAIRGRDSVLELQQRNAGDRVRRACTHWPPSTPPSRPGPASTPATSASRSGT
ncbi:hypothetical protein HEP87_60185 [Streptomyces sp. S1D4-11]